MWTTTRSDAGKVLREARDQGGESLDAAGGGADHDNVTVGHHSPVCLKPAKERLEECIVHTTVDPTHRGSRIKVLAESSPARCVHGVGWGFTSVRHWRSAHVHHLQAEQAPDLGDASGVVADTQCAVMCRSVAAPAVDELGRGQ